jgi:hypothetical protein
MPDMVSPGIKADAHRVRDLYRAGFQSPAKSVARDRVIAAMKAAGVTTVLDLWGGGMSAKAFVDAGFRVISVENGSMKIMDRGREVSTARKRRAFEMTAAEDGYEARWIPRGGSIADIAAECDGAFLDFCGPWSKDARAAVEACRHMKAVAVTLVPDHDGVTNASNGLEREMAYQLFLKMAWAEKPRWAYMNAGGQVRRLTDYRRHKGPMVYVFLLSHEWLQIPYLTQRQREHQRPDMHQRHLGIKRDWYQRLPAEVRADKQARNRAQQKVRFAADPAANEVRLLRMRHRQHLRDRPALMYRRQPCPLCEAGPAPDQ